jgi:hypothetical protein
MELKFKKWLIDEAMIGNPGTSFIGPTPSNACDACKTANSQVPKPSTACPACINKSYPGNQGQSGTPGPRTPGATTAPITGGTNIPAPTTIKTNSQPTKTSAK